MPRAQAVWSLVLFAVACNGDDDESTIENALTVQAPIVASATPLVGTLPGSLSVSGDGAAVYALPLEVPPGRAGIEPHLSLAYSSRSGNGIAGVGWSVTGLSQISRCGSTYFRDHVARAVELSNNDHFCIDGVRLVQIATSTVTTPLCAATSHDYRTEPDSGQRIVTCGEDALGPLEWIVYSQDGRATMFGDTSGTRMGVVVGQITNNGDPASSVSRRLAWLQSRVQDRVGNYVTYQYAVASAIDTIEWYPTTINYTGFSNGTISAAPTRTVTFGYEGRTDRIDRYVAGVEIQVAHRLKSVTMTAPDAPEQSAGSATVRQYRLAYTSTPSTSRSTLTGISVCDRFGECLPPTQITYSQPTVSFVGTTQSNAPSKPGGKRLFAADLNNDGRDDLYLVTDVQSGSETAPQSRADVGQIAGGSGNAPTLGPPAATSAIDLAFPDRATYDVSREGSVDLIADACMTPLECSEDPPKCGEKFCPSPAIEFRPSVGNGTFGTTSLRNACSPAGCVGPETVTDLNGDGLVDVSSAFVYMLDLRSTSATPKAYPNPLARNYSGPSRALDLDGDGVPELLVPRNDTTKRYDALHVRGATGSEFVDVRPTNYVKPQNNCEVVADVNGDGLVDFIDISGAPTVRINRGDGRFDAAVSWGGPSMGRPVCTVENLPGASWLGWKDAGVYAIDYNEDGLQDLLVVQPVSTNPAGERAHVLISTGSSFVDKQLDDITFTDGAFGCANKAGAPTATPLDINADGHTDVAFLCTTATGTTEWRLFTQSRTSVAGGKPDVITDIRNGVGELVRHVDYKLTTDGSVNTPAGINGRTWVQPMLVVATESLELEPENGGTLYPIAQHTYAGGALSFDGEDGWLGFSTHTVTDPRTGAVATTTYATEGAVGTGAAHRTVGTYLQGRPFHPFKGEILQYRTSIPLTSTTSLVTTTDNVPAVIPITYPSGIANYVVYGQTSTTTVVDSGVQISKSSATTTIDTCGNATSRTVDRDVGAAITRKDVSTATYSPVTGTSFCDLGSSWIAFKTDDKTVSTVGTATATHEVLYKPEADGSGRVHDAIRQPTDSSDTALCTRVVLRDLFGSPTVVDATAGAGCARNVNTRTTSTAYNSITVAGAQVYEGILPASVTDSLGHTLTTSMLPGFAVPYVTRDPNGVTEVRRYDGFGRLVRTDNPDQTGTLPAARFSTISRVLPSDLSAAPCTSIPLSATLATAEVATGADGGTAITCRDRRGDARRIARTAIVGGGYTFTDASSVSNFPGRPYLTLRPHLASEQSMLGSVYGYDNAGRVTLSITSDPNSNSGSVVATTTYTGSVTDTIDGSNVHRRKTRAPYGAVIATSIFPNGSTAATTTYTYGPFDTLTSITDALGNVVTQSFDSLGRRTSLVDADVGTITDLYDSFGEVRSETKPAGTTTMTYDLGGRLKTRVGPDGTDTLTYDPAHGIGKVASITRSGTGIDSVTRTIAYDVMSRPTSSTLDVAGTDFDTTTTYDALERPLQHSSASIPGLGRIRTKPSYGPFGAMIGLALGRESATCTASSQCGSGETCRADLGNICGRTLWTATKNDGEDHMTGETFGNGVTATHAYFGAYESVRTAVAGTTTIQRDTYQYQPNGSLAQRGDTVRNATEKFTYDGADRLATATVTGQPMQTYTYDAIGNMTFASDIRISTVCTSGNDMHYDKTSGAGPHFMTSTGCTGVSAALLHDASGNHTNGTDTRDAFTWTSFGKLATTKSAREAWTLTYDANHQLVRKDRTAAPAPTTPFDRVYYADGLERRQVAGTSTETDILTIPLGSATFQLQWDWNGTSGTQSLLYLHKDRLGSPEIITNATGAVVERRSYDAWGNMRGADMVSAPPWPWVTWHTYTDQDFAFGASIGDGSLFIDMGGRVYQPIFKQFWSPDPTVSAPFYGPSWNRYSYVLGNPLKFTDPTGFEPVSNEEWARQEGIIANMFNAPGLNTDPNEFVSSWLTARTAHFAPIEISISQTSDGRQHITITILQSLLPSPKGCEGENCPVPPTRSPEEMAKLLRSLHKPGNETSIQGATGQTIAFVHERTIRNLTDFIIYLYEPSMPGSLNVLAALALGYSVKVITDGTVAQTTSVLQDPSTYGFVFIGHGGGGALSASDGGVDPRKLQANPNLHFLYLDACVAGDLFDAWQRVGPVAAIYSTKGLISGPESGGLLSPLGGSYDGIPNLFDVIKNLPRQQ